MTKQSESLRERVGSLVGQKAPKVPEECFHCGGSTALGRMTTMLEGRKVVSCFRKECYEALAARVGASHAEA